MPYEYKKIALQEDIKLTTTEIENGVDITDENGNVLIELQNGNIKVANFDSAELDTLVNAIVALMQGQGITISNNQINSNILYEEIGSPESPIVGTGQAGFMIII